MEKRYNHILQIIYLYIVPIFLCISCQSDYSISNIYSRESAIVHLQVKSEKHAGFTTRSINENTINDLHILIYNNSGELIGQKYSTNSNVSIPTYSAKGCTIYAIVNTDNENFFKGYDIHSEIYLKNLTYSISTWDELTKGTVCPMTGSIENVTITEGINILQTEMTVKRMIAKVTLNVEAASDSRITITDYRIYSIPKRTYYILHPLNTENSAEDVGTRANDASLPQKAADWMESKMIPTSTGFSTTFYMFENRAGVNNQIQKQQDKNKINAPDSATYIIIHGKAPKYQHLTWKIYLGATNTTNFNIKRNCTYTYNIILKPTMNDTRVSYIKSGNIWAGSNIYWDGSKLTFDEVIKGDSELKQGVYFRWGSLIGLSPTGSIPDKYYIPVYDASAPVNSIWQARESYPGNSIYCFNNEDLGNSNDDPANTCLNDADRNTDTFYHDYKGDICLYLSKTNAVKGNWRMPTIKEFGEASQYSNTGSYNDISNTNSDGTYIIPTYKSYKLDNGDIVKMPISGIRNSDTGLDATGKWGYYWSCSTHSGNYAFHTWFYNPNSRPISYSPRTYFMTIRCVQN